MSETYIDISPVIHEGLAVWPGDVKFSRNVSLDFKAGHNLVLSSVQATVHLGAHADAPSHYHPQGVSIERRSLDRYMGPCQVMRVQAARGARIRVEDVESRPIRAPRMLFATGSYPNPDAWNSDFNSLSPELIHYLADTGVVLIGLDTPSIDPFESKALESHNAVYARDLAVLEGLVLDAVAEGVYELIALPLRLAGADASPVRAVLRPLTKVLGC